MIHVMKATLNVTVERELADYLERYRTTHHLKTRSDAVEQAIRTLRRLELERDAILAAKDPEQQADADWWAFTGADGLRG
jgi:Arc/MetJ-type ribon-helix-helix transcriptional regulator